MTSWTILLYLMAGVTFTNVTLYRAKQREPDHVRAWRRVVLAYFMLVLLWPVFLFNLDGWEADR